LLERKQENLYKDLANSNQNMDKLIACLDDLRKTKACFDRDPHSEEKDSDLRTFKTKQETGTYLLLESEWKLIYQTAVKVKNELQ